VAVKPFRGLMFGHFCSDFCLDPSTARRGGKAAQPSVFQHRLAALPPTPSVKKQPRHAHLHAAAVAAQLLLPALLLLKVIKGEKKSVLTLLLPLHLMTAPRLLPVVSLFCPAAPSSPSLCPFLVPLTAACCTIAAAWHEAARRHPDQNQTGCPPPLGQNLTVGRECQQE
jgi:hypothetical protein